jgi:hypothetical protein
MSTKEYHRNYEQINIEKRKKQKADWYQKNKERFKKIKSVGVDKVKKNKKEYQKEWREKNKKRLRLWREKNKDNIKKQQVVYNKKKRNTDPKFALSTRIRNAFNQSFKAKSFKKTSKTKEILGCSFEYFKIHLESQFEVWMNWDNRGRYNGTEGYGWDIDHIVPISSAITEEELIRLNHYTNLRPLCGYINRHVKRNSEN